MRQKQNNDTNDNFWIRKYKTNIIRKYKNVKR